MKPRKWDSDIYSTFHVIESIKPPRKESIQSNEPMALALEQIRKFIHQSKDSSHETKVCYISTELPDSSPKCSQLLQVPSTESRYSIIEPFRRQYLCRFCLHSFQPPPYSRSRFSQHQSSRFRPLYPRLHQLHASSFRRRYSFPLQILTLQTD